MKTYLIAHTNPDKTGVAQATIQATSEAKALKKFADQFPGRIVTVCWEHRR